MNQMVTIEYSLFRAKMIHSGQQSLLRGPITPRGVFEEAIAERPSLEIGLYRTWHIGNVEWLGEDVGYFAFGRTTNATNTKFDESTGNFIEEDFETSPYTHVVFNSRIGFVGIAHNHRLAKKATSIARKLSQVLQGAPVVVENEVDVIVAPISDPNGFLSQISKAYRVLSFTAHFTGPNPFDADEYFQRPLSVYAAKANASGGKTVIDGDELNKEVVGEVARSTAASGNKATARVKKTKNQAPVTIGLKDEPVKRKYDEQHHDPVKVLKDLSALYNEVRDDA